MSSPSQSRTPIVEFLGAEAGIGGPFALLGLEHEIVSDEQVINACRRRLRQVDHHPQRSTPNADEVRLALHAAASQLLDHDLRVQLAKRWPPGIPMSMPKAWIPKERKTQLKPGLIEKARLLIGASGGWNSTARKRLAYFARVNRLTAMELVGALGGMSSSNPKSALQTSSRTPLDTPSARFELIAAPPETARQWVPIYALLAIMALAVLFTLNLPAQLGARQQSNQARESNEPLSLNESEFEQISGTSPTNQRDKFAHYTAIAHELDQLAARAQTDPAQSIERFNQIYPIFVDRWAAFPEQALKRSTLNIAEFVRNASRSDADQQHLGSNFECDSTDISKPHRRMIRAAVIDLLLSEYQLPTTLRDQLNESRQQCLPDIPHPTDDIGESLSLVCGLLGVESNTDDPEWWLSWMLGVNAISSNDDSQKTKLVLSALAARLRMPDPIDSQWKRTSSLLAESLAWKSASTESYWLLSQLNDETVNTKRIAALTEGISASSKASQINVQMVLNPAATFRQRQDLAEKYRQAWSVDQTDSQAPTLLSDLINEMHVAVSLTPARVGPEEAAKSFIQLARLNTAMWQYDQGRDAQAVETLKTYDQALPPDDPKTSTISLSLNSRDTQWAEQAMNAQSPEELASFFRQLVADNGPGLNSAHALVYLSTLHANSQMRSTARSQVLRYKDQATILIALDFAASNKRVSTRLAQLISDVLGQSLPARTSDSWYQAVHRSLLSRLVNSLSHTTNNNLSRLESDSASVFSSRVDQQIDNPEVRFNAIEAVRRLYRQSLKDIDAKKSPQLQSDLDVILAEIEVATKRAQSPLHLFLAYQSASCKLLAIRVEQTLSGRSPQVQEILDELDVRLDQSQTVLNQMIQVERCTAQLWMLLKQGGKS